ncbi:hypothetical protein B0H17DRAFT_1335850 [Mycena rosella]|uniref:Uncharacterized protein n=1 Tax=Mycena rosella TaxID=1033263 RepID=A0AAD7CXX7_MYCRO|nr:hypothetical protein B0H17DRAFT_1335850 [Mycena rosella]
MPALPTAPTAAPSHLLSPQVGLAGFLVVVVLVSGTVYLGRRLVNLVTDKRRARSPDVEKTGDASTVVAARKDIGPVQPTPVTVLIAAREALHVHKRKVAVQARLQSSSKTIKTEVSSKPVYTANSPVIAQVPVVRILRQQGVKNAPGASTTRSIRTPPGLSPLRSVHCAPQPVLLPVLSTVIDKTPVPVVTPTALDIPAAPTRSALILARLADDSQDFDERIRSSPLRPAPTQPRVLVASRLGNTRRGKHIQSTAPTSPTGKWLSGRITTRSGSIRRDKENGGQIQVPQRARCAP